MMRNCEKRVACIRLVLASLSLLCFCGTAIPVAAASPVPAQGAAAQSGKAFWICRVPASEGMYYSGVFKASDKGNGYTIVATSFSNFVKTKYNLKNAVPVCIDYGPAGEQLAENAFKTFASRKAILTGWNFTGEASAANEPSPLAGHDGVTSTADISGTSKPYYCYLQYIFPGEHQQTTYTTGVFHTTQSENWTIFWWNNYIRSTYNIPKLVANITVACDSPGANPAQQEARVANQISAWKMHNEKVVQLNWQPTQTPPPGVVNPYGMEVVNGEVVKAPPIGTSNAPAGPPGSFALCFENTGPKNYVSAIFDASKGDKAAWEVAFPKYLDAKMGPQIGNGACMIYPSRAAAERMLQTWKQQETASHKVVETGWTPELGSGPTASAPEQPGQDVLCYSDVAQSPVYLSADIHINVPYEPGAQSGQSDGGRSVHARDELKAAFLAYLEKQYGYHSHSAYPAYCDGAPIAGELANRREVLRTRFHQMKFVETGWTPGKLPDANSSASTPKPATPPPSAAQTAYEKAMAAERPRSAGAQPSQSTPPVDTSGKKYSYCFATSGLPHAPSEAGRSNFYVSAIFAADSATHPGPAFQKMLQTAHPREGVQTPVCSAPAPMAATQASRNKEIGARSHNPYITPVEVNWKP